MSFSSSAEAYGIEGLFGGRISPDSTFALNDPVEVELRPERAESVLQRPRPDYDPVPVEVGSFDLFPMLEVGEAYDSNIYATPHKTSDAITTEHPAVNMVSNWGLHQVALTAFGDVNQYADHTHENFQDFVSEAQGRYDFGEQTWLVGRAGYQYLAEPRYSPNNLNGSEPTTFNLYEGGASAYRGVGIVQAKLDYDVRHYDYNNTPSSAGTINETFRDRTEQSVTGTTYYAASEDFKPYLRASFDDRAYDDNAQRQSQGYYAVGGARMDFGGITSIDGYAGWMSQDYKNFGAADLNQGMKYGGTLNWNITGLTSLALEGDRTIEETPITGFDSYKATGGSATLTHELLRNVLIEADTAYTNDHFQGTSSRDDNIYTAGGGARWLLNRNFYFDAVYNWSHRVSDAAGFDYVDHYASLRLGAQM